MPCRSASGNSSPRSAPPCCATFFPYGVRAISIFFQPTQFLGATNEEVERIIISISSFHLFADLAKHLAGQPLRPLPACPARRSSSPAHLRLPMRPTRVSQTHRKTKIKNILSCFISFTDEQTFQQVAEEHDAAAIFTYDDFIILSPQRPPPRKFDKSQNL